MRVLRPSTPRFVDALLFFYYYRPMKSGENNNSTGGKSWRETKGEMCFGARMMITKLVSPRVIPRYLSSSYIHTRVCINFQKKL